MGRKIANGKHVAGVVKRVYDDAQRLDWEHRTHREHTEQYARWLEDPLVGGVLSQWMSAEEQRVWLKDGPMKELARALAGEGPFAAHLSSHPRSPKVVVERVLGPPWRVVPGSNDVKPLRCDASEGKRTVRVLWGPARDFKYLLWAALESWEATPSREQRVVVFDTVPSPIATNERQRLERIAARCQLLVTFVRL